MAKLFHGRMAGNLYGSGIRREAIRMKHASDTSAKPAIVGVAGPFAQRSRRWSRNSIPTPMAQSARWKGVSIASC
ncbi:hypothetical protein [Methyloglobulus sp.]|uniref:hypothetical protein n=1 Tax=Methyloglobulus sp. TaxID=2518622 RepID=UPI003988EF27